RDTKTGTRHVTLTDGRNMSFDKQGRVTSGDNADGSKTRYEYNERGTAERFVVTNKDGSEVSMDSKGRVIGSKTTDGQKREFGYGADGKLSSIKEPDGRTWTSTDGDNWTSNKGDKWKGAVWIGQDGTYNYSQGNTVITKQLDGNTLNREQSGATR